MSENGAPAVCRRGGWAAFDREGMLLLKGNEGPPGPDNEAGTALER